MATKLPLPVFYIPPRPPQRQPAGKDSLPHERIPPSPQHKPSSQFQKPGTATVKKAIDPHAMDDGMKQLEIEPQNRRRHSAHDELQEAQKAIRKVELVHPPPVVAAAAVAAVHKVTTDNKPHVKMEIKTKKPATTPGPATRQGRKSRGGALRAYGYEDPLLDGTGRDYRARLVTFYKNGDPFFTGIKTSFRPGRDFVSMEALFNYLTTRMDLPLGVRYIFTVEGVRIRRLDEFDSGASYVCSSRRKFEPLNYTGDHKKMWNPHLKYENPINEELKLFRAPSPPVKKINGVRERWSPDAPYNGSLPGSREGRVIKVINNLNQKIQSRILLNLRTAQPWEEVLEDLGQALKLKGAKKLYSVNGQEVKSFSQLRNEFKDVETFYLDTGESLINRIMRGDNRKESSRSLDDQVAYDHRRDTRGKRPGSAPPVPGDRDETPSNEITDNLQYPSPPNEIYESSTAPVRVLINGARRDFYPPLHQRLRSDLTAPEKFLKLDWVYGYRGYDSKENLKILASGELIYYVATVVVMYDKIKHRQRHYLGHTEEITCLALTNNADMCATGQKEGKGKTGMAHIRIWDVFSLTTLTIIGVNEVDNGVGALAFSRQNEGSYLMVMDDSADHVLSMWDWKHEHILGRTTTYTREVNGGKFHPHDDNVIITYGRSHLTAWRRRKDGMFQKHELMKTIGDNILCLEFDEDGDIIAGDSSGAITVWTDSGDGSFRLYKEFQAHQRGINSLLVLADGTLLSGGNDRYIKAWRNVKQYKLMATTMLPDNTGGVRTLCPQRLSAEDSSVYVGTTRNVILEGSLYRRFSITVQGHFKNLLALATDPDFASFVSGGEDKAVCKWTMHRLQWRAQIETECTALAFHPSDLVVVAGTQDGHIVVLNADTGMHITTINVSKSPVTCMSFNKEGTQLAVGNKDGNIYFYSVTSTGFVYKRRNIMRGNEVLRNIDFSQDGRYLQSDSEDYDLIYWYIPNFEQEKMPSTMRDVRWNRLTCTLGYSINGIWNNINQRIQGLITSSHVSSSSKLIAAADDEGYVRLFRYPCISPKADYHEIKPYTGRVTSVRFLYDDSFLITAGGTDAALMQWMVVSNR